MYFGPEAPDAGRAPRGRPGTPGPAHRVSLLNEMRYADVGKETRVIPLGSDGTSALRPGEYPLAVHLWQTSRQED
jgi:hypothetical protein